MALVYFALASVVVLGHFAYLAVLVFGGVAARRWPWLLWAHLTALAWGLGAVLLRYDCPLTSLELGLRSRAGLGAYEEGFLRHYVRGVLFPDALTPLVVTGLAGVVLAGWVRLVRAAARPAPASPSSPERPEGRAQQTPRRFPGITGGLEQ